MVSGGVYSKILVSTYVCTHADMLICAEGLPTLFPYCISFSVCMSPSLPLAALNRVKISLLNPIDYNFIVVMAKNQKHPFQGSGKPSPYF